MPIKDIDKKAAEQVLKEGMKTPFWELILETIKESKDAIQSAQDGKDINDLPADEYKIQNEVFKAKKKFLDQLAVTPDNLISWLQHPDNKQKNFDPYAEPEE